MTIYKGENRIIRIPLLQRDGVTPLVISTLSLLYVKFIQHGRPLVKYIFKEGVEPVNAAIRVATTGVNVLEVELTKAQSLLLNKGILYMRVTLENADALYIVDTLQHDEFEVEVLTVL